MDYQSQDTYTRLPGIPEKVVTAWMDMAMTFGMKEGNALEKRVQALSDPYLRVSEDLWLKALSYCRNNFDRFPIQKMLNEAMKRVGADNQSYAYEECRFCQSTGWVYISKRHDHPTKEIWGPVAVRCFCDNGEHLSDRFIRLRVDLFNNPKYRPDPSMMPGDCIPNMDIIQALNSRNRAHDRNYQHVHWFPSR